MEDERLTYQDIAGSGQLLVMMIYQAVRDLGRPEEPMIGIQAYMRDRARAWFESKRQDEGSFRWVCEHLRISAEWIQKRIRKGQYRLNPDGVGDLPERARQLLEKHGITVSEAAQDMRVSRESFSNVINGRVGASRLNNTIAGYLDRLEASG